MTKYNINWRDVVMILGIFVYFTFKYVPIEGEIIFPIILGISFLCGAVYMKKKRKTALQISMAIIMGIIGVLVGGAHYVGGILQNKDHQGIIIAIIFILLDIGVVLRLIDSYNNESVEQFKKLRNRGIATMTLVTIMIGVIVYGIIAI